MFVFPKIQSTGMDRILFCFQTQLPSGRLVLLVSCASAKNAFPFGSYHLFVVGVFFWVWPGGKGVVRIYQRSMRLLFGHT